MLNDNLYEKLKFGRGSLLPVLLTFSLFASLLHAEDVAPKKTLFIPKSATAAAYILGRLSNQELTEAPRGEFVYVALLQRKGLERKYRIEALEGLAKIHNSDVLSELLAGVETLDKKGEEHAATLRDLSSILLQSKPEELAAKRIVLEKLLLESKLAITHQIGFAAIVTADNSISKIWQQTQANPKQLADLIRSIELIRSPELRASFYPQIELLLHKADSSEVRQAAITAIVVIPGHETETFNTLTGFVKTGTERVAAITGLQRIPRKSWPKEQVEPLLETLVVYLKTVPVVDRTSPEFVNAFQFSSDLATLLPKEKATTFGKTLRSLGVSVFVVRTVLEQMIYDKTLIVVEAGTPVEIILINEDSMPHNLVVVAPGALEEIGQAAEKMSPDADAQGRVYIPSSPKVLHATKLVEPGQQIKLNFTAPNEPGDYQYVCTFPGHWRRMIGTLAVVKDVEAYLESHATVVPKITEWTMEMLAPDLVKTNSSVNAMHGKELFTKLACAGCHKHGKEGVDYGPDLTDIFKRYKNDRAEVLRQIIDPSVVIEERYRNYQIELKDGDTVTGMVIKEDTENLTIQSGPSNGLIQTLAKTTIHERQPQNSSPMPSGLLNALSKEEIFDLLAWLEFGENAPPHKH